MIRTKLAKKVLTKKEQRHLTQDANVNSMAVFVLSRKQQVEKREKSLMEVANENQRSSDRY